MMVELKFKSDTTGRKAWFTGLSFSHPAKMSLPLQVYLIERYTEPGGTILDPMAGSGTILVAASLGRNVICVDLEERFCEIMRGNWEKIQQRGPQMGFEMGEAKILRGDARHLEGLLVEVVITSPPYTNRMDGGVRGSRAGMIPYTDDPPDAWYTQRDQANIGNLPYRDISAIITSPPYEGSISSGDGAFGEIREFENRISKEEILKHRRNGAFAYSGAADNIGNLKGNDYLSQMLLVYQQCYRVLRPGGKLILVTKNFIRDKALVRLDLDTICLCEKVGFSLMERLQRKLTSVSFWRTIYKRKYPEAPEIRHEDILVFEKEKGPL